MGRGLMLLLYELASETHESGSHHKDTNYTNFSVGYQLKQHKALFFTSLFVLRPWMIQNENSGFSPAKS